jgi:hypothetical protein
MGANVVTSGTGVVVSADPAFTFTYSCNGSQGIVLYLKHDKGTETGVTLTFDVVATSLSASDLYKYTTISGTTLSAYTLTFGASADGNYRIPLPMIQAEHKVIVNIAFSGANTTGALVINALEP